MGEWEVRSLKNGRGEEFGIGYYHPEFSTTFPFKGMIKRRYPNGVIRRVWCDSDGRAMMIGWFFKSWD